MRALGIDHGVVRAEQRALYTQWTRNNPGGQITWWEIEQIETQALNVGGAAKYPGLARAIVREAIRDLQDAGVTFLRTPWGP
jgi:hypothetical protein